MFEGLLPEPHNTTVINLLYILGTRHALAKLRLHTEWSVAYLEVMTKRLGHKLREFVKSTCDAYDTKELPCEAAARARRKAADTSRKQGKTRAPHPTARRKVFSL